MEGWSAVINVVLAAAAVGFALWGFRQWLLLRRLHRGLLALREDRTEFRVRRDPSDAEPVLKAFDHLAQELALRKRESSAPGTGLKSALMGLCDALRPPLVAIQGYASLLAQDRMAAATGRNDCVRNLLTQVNGLLQLLESTENVSELRRRLSGLQRSIPVLEPQAASAAVLLIDDEGPFSEALTQRLGEIGWKLLVAPGASAAAVMARAIGPRVVLANAARPDGLGWKALAQVLRVHPVDCFAWLFRRGTDEPFDVLWTPHAVLLWPVTNGAELLQQLRERAHDRPIGLAGAAELVPAVAQWLSRHEMTTAETSAAWTLAQCCTIELPADPSDPQGAAEYVLIVPVAAVEDHPGLLADAFAAVPTPIRSGEVADPQEELVERLRALAVPAGVP